MKPSNQNNSMESKVQKINDNMTEIIPEISKNKSKTIQVETNKKNSSRISLFLKIETFPKKNSSDNVSRK